ncbi:hypothetical protein OKJ48_33260 [Streptomyces kunmingensis]|uniref:Uncharacterized protein n=1 Tax=Streptomyces kunmingensis TaxID=68225 RepID=A0ABU6CK35_9ACTN|nr:hypothetical protein [Streptomyces kunmingensis]MEB3965063.1 hypothetical protein [Streptomyces kunmingensis]
MPEPLDDLALLRAADPVPAQGPRYADGPQHHRAERALDQLLHSSRTRRAGRVLVLRAEIAVCALAALLVLVLSYAAAPPASATPPPAGARSAQRAVELLSVAPESGPPEKSGASEPGSGTEEVLETAGPAPAC